MLKRKIITAILTFLISTLIITSLSPVDVLLDGSHNYETSTFFQDILLISVYVVAGVFLYGLPVSILIELITQKPKEARFALSFPLHILFGIIPVFVLGFLAIFSLLVSIIYLLIDELIRFFTKEKKISGYNYVKA